MKNAYQKDIPPFRGWWAVALVSFLGTLASASAESKAPVKVYIMAGQSNTIGFGQIEDGGFGWRTAHFKDVTVATYPGPYDGMADYEKMEPLKTVAITNIGNKGDAFPEGEVRVARGKITLGRKANITISPGHGESRRNVMRVRGEVVHEQDVEGKSIMKPIKVEAGEEIPFSIVYYGKRADSVGWFTQLDKPGTLHTAVKYQGLFPDFVDKNGGWVSRDDVWYKESLFNDPKGNKWLSVGCGASPGHVGPELGFGFIMGDYHEEPVLILKAAQGNRSLGWDFLPPGSERYEVGDKVHGGYKDTQPTWPKGSEPAPMPNPKWYAGKQYDDCFSAVKKVLANFDSEFPHFARRGHEIAGFVWFQGHKDQGIYANRYEINLVRLIKSLRADFNAPNAKFVVLTGCGNPGTVNGGLIIAEAQLAVDGEKGKYPEFKGIVKSVDIRNLWPVKLESPNGSQSFHYFQNAIAYTKIGQAMGKAMIDIQQQR